MKQRIILKGATVIRDNRAEMLDVAVEGGKIVSVEANISSVEGDKVVDCSGKILCSGLVDLHVHLREPGFSSKETIASGTAAAAHGGFTTVCSMPNLAPAPDTMEHLQQQLDLIEKGAVIKVLPYATITSRRAGDELVDFAALKPYVAGFSDDGTGVQCEEVMKAAMKAAAANDCIIAAHCEVDDLLRGGYIHDGEYARINGHRGICSESEWAQIERDIELAAEAGCRYHVCHISTKESVALIREAKKRGVKITCETGPHYLTMCDMDLKEEGRFKMNPPIRSAADRDALVEGIKDGTIDVVATDHAPHTARRSRAVWSVALWALLVLKHRLRWYIPSSSRRALSRLRRLLSCSPRHHAAYLVWVVRLLWARLLILLCSTSTRSGLSSLKNSSRRVRLPHSRVGSLRASAA